MHINFAPEEEKMILLYSIFENIDPEQALFMNHYQLSRECGQHPQDWKEFLTHPKVAAFIESELIMYQQHQLRQMVRDASDDKRAVGAAQMINALAKLDTVKEKTGDIIIYTHVPLTEDQQQSPVEYKQEATNVLKDLAGFDDTPIIKK